MKTIFLECHMGASGDMFMASLLELLPEKQSFIDQMNGLGLKGVKISAGPSRKQGIMGTHVSVSIDGIEEGSPDGDHQTGGDRHIHESVSENIDLHEHSQNHPQSGILDIEHIISQLALPEAVRNHALAVYDLIAAAESHVHGKSVDQIHFHEVGMLDAICDIVGSCLLMDKLAPDRVVASPIHVGSGEIRCAHGILPVPAPATAYILQGVPIYGGSIRGELCTPTGAALLKYFVTDFGDMPVMNVTKIGYGMGNKDFVAANCIRAFMGDTEDNRDRVVELCCNLDDMTPEAIGFAQERLFDAGALDVFTLSVGMKKNRPGIMLTCLCRENQRDQILRQMFRHTTTIGIREYLCNRYTLDRSEYRIRTELGMIRIKKSTGWGSDRKKAEYDDVVKIARDSDMAMCDVYSVVDRYIQRDNHNK